MRWNKRVWAGGREGMHERRMVSEGTMRTELRRDTLGTSILLMDNALEVSARVVTFRDVHLREDPVGNQSTERTGTRV